MARAAISVRSSASPTLKWIGRDVVAVLSRQSFPQRSRAKNLAGRRSNRLDAWLLRPAGAAGGGRTARPPPAGSRPNHDAVAFGQLESSSTGSKSTRSPLEDDEIAQSRQLQELPPRSESLPIPAADRDSTNAHGL